MHLAHPAKIRWRRPISIKMQPIGIHGLRAPQIPQRMPAIETPYDLSIHN
jgi:hypothetical protein